MQTLRLPLQIYRSGAFFIHLVESDPHDVQGGYKHFSRSLWVDRDEVVANLLVAVPNLRKFSNLMNEIGIMRLRLT